MAIDDGCMEVPDSEDEPMMSSPFTVSKSDADKLRAADDETHQDRQDGLLEANDSYQAHAKALVNTAAAPIEVLHADQCNASINVEESLASQINVYDVMLARHERQASEAGGGSASLAPPPDLNARNTACRLRTAAVEDLISHDAHIGSVRPHAVITGESPDIKCDPDDERSKTRESELQICELPNIPYKDSRYVPGQKPGDTRWAANIAGSGLTGEQVSKEAYAAPIADTISATTAETSWHKWISQSGHGNDNLHNELSVEDPPHDPPHDVVVEERSASPGARDSGKNNCDQAVVDIDRQTMNILEAAPEPVDHGNTKSASTFEAYSTPQLSLQDGTYQSNKEEESLKDLSQIPSVGPDLEMHKNQENYQNEITTVQKPTMLQQAVISTDGSSRNSETQGLQAQKLVNDGSCADNKANTVIEAGNAEAELSPATSHASPDLTGPSLAHSPLSKTPQDSTLTDLKRRKATLLASLTILPAIQVLIEESENIEAEADSATNGPTEADVMAAASKIVREHIKLLHEYNELKDVGQGLMGLIADQRGVRIVEVQEEFGIEAKD